MKARSFWRFFSAFMLVTLATVILFTAVMTLALQRERQESYENEVRMQACEVADYMAHLNQLSFVRENTTMQYIIRRKLNGVHEQYNADVWIVSYESGLVQYIDSSWNTANELPEPDDAVLEQLGVAPENAMALGDECNDLEMLQLAGLSIAMEGGDPRVIEAADRTTASAESELRKLLSRA